MTRRRLRRLHREARDAWKDGQHWHYGHKVAAPGYGPLRIAFDAGLKSAAGKHCPSELPLDVWQAVVAEWMRSY